MQSSYTIIRLIALWVIFTLSLGMLFWSTQKLTVAVIKNMTGGYLVYNQNVNGNNYCLQYPNYPSMEMNVDKNTLEKYNAEMKKYNTDYSKLCQEDLAKQKLSEKNQERFSGLADITQNAVLILLSIATLIISLGAIKKGESN